MVVGFNLHESGEKESERDKKRDKERDEEREREKDWNVPRRTKMMESI